MANNERRSRLFFKDYSFCCIFFIYLNSRGKFVTPCLLKNPKDSCFLHHLVCVSCYKKIKCKVQKLTTAWNKQNSFHAKLCVNNKISWLIFASYLYIANFVNIAYRYIIYIQYIYKCLWWCLCVLNILWRIILCFLHAP